MASGFLIVKKFEVLYKAALEREALYEEARRRGEYDKDHLPRLPIYGIYHPDRDLNDRSTRRYHGIDREPLDGLSFDFVQSIKKEDPYWPGEATAASDLLDSIEIVSGREDGWVTELNDIKEVWAAVGADQDQYEVIFAKQYDDDTSAPLGAEFLGADTAYFVSDHFSCICDALFFPRWHGCDEEGVLFREHFDKLNLNGLFNSNDDALEYLRYYLSFDWTERATSDPFTSIEVYAVPSHMLIF